MKVILIRDVARLGKRHEVKDVPDGHALNFLIPRKLAVIATPYELKRLSEEVSKHDAAHTSLMQTFQGVCDALRDREVTYVAEASEQGHLFKGLNEHDIAVRIKEELGVALDEHAIKLPHHIKSVGIHEVELSLGGVHGRCTLHVVKK